MTPSTSAPLSWDRQSGAGYRSDLLSLEECTGLCVSVATDEVAVVLIGHEVCDLLLPGSHSADKAADGVLFLRTDELPVVRWGLGGRQATARLRVLEASLFYDTFLRHSEDLEQLQLDLILSCLLADGCLRWIDGQSGSTSSSTLAEELRVALAASLGGCGLELVDLSVTAASPSPEQSRQLAS